MKSVQICDKKSNNAKMIEWTLEQEVALQRAYFNQRPSQCFWRDIAKQVPGKTASECFHKFYSAHPTPPLHQQTHARRWDFTSPIKKFKPNLSPSRLILQTKNEGITDFRKKIRNMFIKQHLNRDKANEEDDFAALEQQCSRSSEDQNVAPNNNVNATGGEVPSVHCTTNQLSSCDLRPSSTTSLDDKAGRLFYASHAHFLEKAFPELDQTTTQCQDYNSPEVLKKYKDMKHLDRYVDILVCRQKAMKRQKKHIGTNTTMASKTQNVDLVSAKAAVIAGAQHFLRTGSKEVDDQCYDEGSEEDLDGDSLLDDADL